MTEKKKQAAQKPDSSLVWVSVRAGDAAPVDYEFRRPFTIGRDPTCEIQIQNPGISRQHAEVTCEGGTWSIRDLDSANGMYSAGKRVSLVPIESTAEVELGLQDAVLSFRVEGKSTVQGLTIREKAPSVTDYLERYFGDQTMQAVGQHTRLLRQAFKIVDRRKKRRFAAVIGVVLLMTAAISSYSYWQHRELERRTSIAEEIFYSMKALEVEIARLRAKAAERGDQEILEEIEKQSLYQNNMARNYQRFLEEIEFFESDHWSETDLVVLRVARLFGECELGMPDDFRERVYEFIEEWKTSRRLEQGIRRAVENGYAQYVVDAMLEQDLPPQFFFLALQESGFNEQAIGPATRFGIAKGIWQFIPATAMRYGLQVGPLVELPRYDPRDQRHEAEKATWAAARYIRDIYNTEAQASGLLVIASYNWGENNVRRLVRSLPENPRERNFWKLLEKHGKRIPRETYRYVFFIISAAVIGENPALFGFSFENPLAGIAPSMPASD